MFTEDDIRQMRGAAVVDAAGAKVGSVGDVYLDDATGQPAWATVESGLFSTRVRFVPLVGARMDGRHLMLPFSRDAVLAAPHVAEDEHLSAEEEAALNSHYGVQRQVAAEGAAPAPAVEDVAPVPGAGHVAESPAAGGPVNASAALSPRVAGDDEALREAEAATEVAHAAAVKADPLGDGSYAGDASKSSLVDTADLEAHDHQLGTHAPVLRPASAPTGPHAVEAAPDPAAFDLPDRVDPADVAALDRAAQAASEAAERRWVSAHDSGASGRGDDL